MLGGTGDQPGRRFPRPSAILLRMASRSVVGAPVVVAVANTGELIQHGAELVQVDMDCPRFLPHHGDPKLGGRGRKSVAGGHVAGLGSVWLGILYLMKQEMLNFLGEPAGEFMAVVPMGYPAKTTEGPKKRPLEATVRRLD